MKECDTLAPQMAILPSKNDTGDKFNILIGFCQGPFIAYFPLGPAWF